MISIPFTYLVNTSLKRPINGLVLHWRGFLKGSKNVLKKNASSEQGSFLHEHARPLNKRSLSLVFFKHSMVTRSKAFLMMF